MARFPERRSARGRDPSTQARQNLIDDGFVRHVARLHREVGLRIDRLALFEQPPQRFRRIGALEQRTVAAAFDPAVEHVDRGAKPHRDSLQANRIAGIGAHERPAAGGQHLRTALQQPRDDARLAGAEIRFAVGGEDFGDGHAGMGLLDLGVGVDEGHARAAPPAGGQPTTCRRPSCRPARPNGGPAQRQAKRAAATLRPWWRRYARQHPTCYTCNQIRRWHKPWPEQAKRRRFGALRVQKCQPCSDSCW